MPRTEPTNGSSGSLRSPLRPDHGGRGMEGNGPGVEAMRRTSIVAGLILSLPIFAAPASAEPADSRPRSVLAEVKALEKPVTYTETKIPLGELVQKVGAD